MKRARFPIGSAHPRAHQQPEDIPLRRLSLLVLAVATALASCGGGNDEARFTAAVFGDVPYGTSPTDTAQFLVFPA